jgi:hypothetical protein
MSIIKNKRKNMLNIFSKRSVIIISTVITLIMFMVVMFIVNPSIDGKDGIGVLSLQLAFDKKVGIEIINNWTQLGIENFIIKLSLQDNANVNKSVEITKDLTPK